MRRLGTFVIGVIVGGILLYATLHHHVVRAADGFHLVPKTEARLAGSYVDIRSFALADWMNRPELVAALMRADRGDLIEGAARGVLGSKLDELLQEPAS